MRGSVIIPEDVDLTVPVMEEVISASEAKAASVSDYFAELYVAGRFADAGWNVYFPHRDQGFDFIISKHDGNGDQILRPVQVKGKYPTEEKGSRSAYGFVGKLTQMHADMVLAIPFFQTGASDMPSCTAYMPRSLIKPNSRGFRCKPASFKFGKPSPRPGYQKFFGADGLKLLEDPNWRDSTVGV
jgi:hypothetical protein